MVTATHILVVIVTLSLLTNLLHDQLIIAEANLNMILRQTKLICLAPHLLFTIYLSES
jgi:hypothetical protein